MKTPTYKLITELVCAINNCANSGNLEWENKHTERLSKLIDGAPSGSGFDSGTLISLESYSMEKPIPERLIFETSFHHMDENGSYTGWTHHKVIVTPSLMFGCNVRVTGRDRNGIKEYIAGVFRAWLDSEAEGAE